MLGVEFNWKEYPADNKYLNQLPNILGNQRQFTNQGKEKSIHKMETTYVGHGHELNG